MSRANIAVSIVVNDTFSEGMQKARKRMKAMLPDTLTVQGRKVIVPRELVAAFNAQWPCSELRANRHYWFEFDANGDLVDTDVPVHDDGQAASAMAEDCKAFLFDGETPQWAE